MPYIGCPSCRKTALRVASRCPHCGLIFSEGMIPPEKPNRHPGLLLLAGALVVLVAAVVVARKWMEAPAAPPPPAGAVVAPAESQPESSVVVIAPSSPAQPPAPAQDSAVDSTPPSAVPPPAAPPPTAPTGEQLLRYATTWVNVRGARSPNAAPVQVLNPGEAVLVDSLVGGWYRVVVDGQAMGYVYSSNLSEEAP